MTVSSLLHERYIGKIYSLDTYRLYSFILLTNSEQKEELTKYLINLKNRNVYHLDSYIANTITTNEKSLKNYCILTTSPEVMKAKAYLRNTTLLKTKIANKSSAEKREEVSLNRRRIGSYLRRTVKLKDDDLVKFINKIK